MTNTISTPHEADIPLACGCPPETRQRQVSEHDVECDGCGVMTA